MKRLLAAVAVLSAGFALPVLAHHSFVVFDHSRQVTVSGVVKEFQWTNPHSWIQLLVTDKDGNAQEWSLEGGSPSILVRNGWKRTSLKPGDRVTVLIYPLNTDEPGCSFLEVHKADGSLFYYHG